jgi:OFA family oxalate/formate antiporter-like MFS transporter
VKFGLLVGAIIISIAFGSLHAFSVLALPLQNAFGTARASVSLGYALAILALTGAVYVAPLIMRRMSPAVMAVLCAVGAAAGLVLAGSGLGLVSFLAGFGVIFGFANGLAYSLFLDRAAAAMAQQKGFAIGLVTATYGGGAALFAPLLGLTTASASVFAALMLLGLAVFLAGLLASYLFIGSGFAIADRITTPETPQRWMLVTWSVYFCGVFGGLMIIGHAAPLLQSKFSGTTLSTLAVMLVAIGNVAGSIGGGLWAQYTSPRQALALPVMIGMFAMALLLLAHSQALALAGLAVVGIAYGGLIAAVPVVILTCAGPRGFAYAFGRIFSAWGLAGLVGPPLAGLLFDYSGTYDSALLLAFFMSIISLALALFVQPGRGSELQYK